MQPSSRTESSVLPREGLVGFYTFQEPEGSVRKPSALTPGAPVLLERGGAVPHSEEGLFAAHAASFGGGPWLEVPSAATGPLNLRGPNARVTVVAWIKRQGKSADKASQCEALAGLWNEHGKRQYCLFLNLRIHGSAEQVGAHVSSIGGPTPGFKYCMDAAIGATAVPTHRWQMVAMTYDGQHARAYLNGRLDVRDNSNPYPYPGGLFDGGADFTVGAVARPARVEMVDGRPVEAGHVQANLFYGQLGGLAIYNRALEADELAALARKTLPTP